MFVGAIALGGVAVSAITGSEKRYHYLHRYRQVIDVLLRHGFGYLVEQVDVAHLVPSRKRVSPTDTLPSGGLGPRLRTVCEELGPAYVKLGQLMSTRDDLLPPEVISELAKLQDKVAPFPAEDAVMQIEQATGRPLASLFSSFEQEPLAAASIGQVHRARLPNGDTVVVKVQRPGVADQIGVDLHILTGLAKRAQERFKDSLVDPVEMADQFSRSMKAELDYTVEARHIERFTQNFADYPGVHIPRVYRDLTTKCILTMECIEGLSINELLQAPSPGIDRKAIAVRGARAFLKQVFVDGYFHGDPHPGNILIEKDGRIAFVDFGVVGRLDPQAMEQLSELLVGLVRKDVDQTIDAMAGIGALGRNTDIRSLRRDVEEIIDCFHGKALREVDFTALLQEIARMAYQHQIRLPQDFLLLGKALITIEGVGKSLDPDFNAVEVAEPLARSLMRRHLDPIRVFRLSQRSLRHLRRVFAITPQRIATIMEQLAAGELAIQLQHVGLESLRNQLDLVSNRLSVAVIVAALIIGSALIISLSPGQGPRLWHLPLLGVVGFVLAAITGLWLVLAILRSGRL